MRLILRKIMQILKYLVLCIDYTLYLILNPFKFKGFPKEIRKILIVELLEIGDLIVITPLIRTVKKKYSNAQIDILVKPSMVDVLSGNPSINEIIPYEGNIVKKLQSRNYDLALLLHPGSFKVSLQLLLSKIKYRVGCTRVGIFSGKGFFLHKKVKPKYREQHKIEDNLDVVRILGMKVKEKDLELYTTSESDKKIQEIFLENKIRNKKIVIHPGANYRSHEWVVSRYPSLIEELSKKFDATIFVTGSSKDKPVTEYICTKTRAKIINLAGRTTLKEFFSVIKCADLTISVDTSALHVAACFQKPVVALFGPSYPKVWYPYTEKRKVLYKGYSLAHIQRTDIMQAVGELIKNENLSHQ